MQTSTDHVTYRPAAEQRLDFHIDLPDGFDPAGPALPLLVFLHGAGERESMQTVRRHGPPKMIDQGHEFQAIVVCPHCPEGSWWNAHRHALLALLDHVQEAYPVDPDRVYLTGLSMGGYGTFMLGAADPARFAALVPICGGGMFMEARQLTRMPIWAFHGDADPVIPLVESQRMIDYANSKDGENARLTIYSGVDHDSWSATYASPEMWEWLFSQRRSIRSSSD